VVLRFNSQQYSLSVPVLHALNLAIHHTAPSLLTKCQKLHLLPSWQLFDLSSFTQVTKANVPAGECRGVQGSAGECRGVQGSAEECRGVQGSARECRGMQENARECRGVQGNAGNAGECRGMQGNAGECRGMQGSAGITTYGPLLCRSVPVISLIAPISQTSLLENTSTKSCNWHKSKTLLLFIQKYFTKYFLSFCWLV